MAGRGRGNRQGDGRPVILALECPVPRSSTRRSQPSQHGGRVSRSGSTIAAAGFIPDTISIHTGEDVVEKVKAYFECHKDIHLSSPNLCLTGHVLSAQGEVSNPTILRHGSPLPFEGIYSIGTLSGWYKIPSDGPVQLDNMKITFYGSDGRGNGGDVTGSLIAATGIQVMVSWIGCADEN